MYSYDEIMKRMLKNVPNTIDKRQGSIIYDAIAPCAAELAQMYINLEIWKEQTYLLTATGINLDNKGADYVIGRKQATYAQRICITIDTNGNQINIPLNSRFSVPNVKGDITYYVKEYINPGECILVCEQAGIVGNSYVGAVLPLFAINNLAESKIVGTLIPGQNVETDEDYRQRILARLNQKAFGGNIADYKETVSKIDGVGTLKVFPVWNGGGTVLLSILDIEYKPISPEFIDIIKNIVDPIEYTGQGVGTAPIGHIVTVKTPDTKLINIEAKLTLDGITAGQVQTDIEKNIEDYLLNLRKQWANNTTTVVYISRIIETIFKTRGIINVSNVKLNGESSDIIMIDTSELQMVPFKGTVTLYE